MRRQDGSLCTQKQLETSLALALALAARAIHVSCASSRLMHGCAPEEVLLELSTPVYTPKHLNASSLKCSVQYVIYRDPSVHKHVHRHVLESKWAVTRLRVETLQSRHVLRRCSVSKTRMIQKSWQMIIIIIEHNGLFRPKPVVDLLHCL